MKINRKRNDLRVTLTLIGVLILEAVAITATILIRY